MDGNWTIALDNNGDIWTWGSNYTGALGNGKQSNTEIRRLPQKLTLNTKFTQISASAIGYWTALDTNGNIWGCGTARYGGLGTEAIIRDNDIYAEKIYTPRQITNGTKFTKMITLQDATLALDENGNIWGWGINQFGVLMSEGKGNQEYLEDYYINTPTKLTNGKRYKDIDYNIAAAGAIDEDNNLYMWGNNSKGVLATDINSCSVSYEPIQVKNGIKFNKFSMGANHVVAIDTEGYLWVWGRETDLGISHNTITKLPGYNLESGVLYEPYKKGTRKYIDVYCHHNSSSATYAIIDSNDMSVWGTLLEDWTGDASEQEKLMNKLKELTIIGDGLGVDKNGYIWRWNFSYIDNEGNKVKTLRPIQITGEKYTVTFKDGDTILKTETVLAGQSATSPDIPTKEGHTFISWDKSFDNVTSDLTVNALWRRDTFTVTFKNVDKVEKIESVQWGESATAPELTKAGYTLSWDIDFNNVTSDLEVNAIWTANTNTAYKVIHHFRNLDTEVEGFIDEEEQKIGTTDTQVVAEYKTKEGFTKNETDTRTVKQGNIAGDGSLVLHLYYTRNTYNITYELNGGEETSPLTNSYIYGKEMILSNKVTKEGYTFAGWYDNSEFGGSPITAIPVGATGNKTFYAKWVEKDKEYYILSERYSIDLEGKTITKVSPETTVENFLSKIETNGTCKVLNAKGEEVNKTVLVGTGYKLQVTFEGQVYTYEIAVRGDIDGNGKLTITDLSMLNQALMEKVTLTGTKKKAADIDYNGSLTITDLSMLNQALMEKITL